MNQNYQDEEQAPRGMNTGQVGDPGEPRATGGRGRGNAANLSREARVRGGQRSAQVQVRDQHGQFAGRADKDRSRGPGGGERAVGGEATPGR
jgi:hypothetical protein